MKIIFWWCIITSHSYIALKIFLIKNQNVNNGILSYIFYFLHISLFSHTHTHILYIYIYICTCIHTKIHPHIHMYTNMYTHTHTHIYIYMYLHTYIYAHTYIRIHTHTHVYIHFQSKVIWYPQKNFISHPKSVIFNETSLAPRFIYCHVVSHWDDRNKITTILGFELTVASRQRMTVKKECGSQWKPNVFTWWPHSGRLTREGRR